MLNIEDLIAEIPGVAPDDRRFDDCETIGVVVPLPRSLFEDADLDLVAGVLPDVERHLRVQVDACRARLRDKR